MTLQDNTTLPKTVYGWAVVDDKGIRIRTVSDTRRAAVINYLMAECGVLVLNSMSDAHVERLWFLHRNGAEAELVTVSAATEAPDFPDHGRPGVRRRDDGEAAGPRTEGVDEIEKLRLAILRIDAINDNPARFNVEINAVCDGILRPELTVPSRAYEQKPGG